jgi:lipid A 3-O-deacylase
MCFVIGLVTSPPTRGGSLIVAKPTAVLCALICVAIPAHADLLTEAKFGLLYSGWSSRPGQPSHDQSLDLNAEAIFTPSVDFLGGQIHPNFGASVSLDAGTNRIYGGAVWQVIVSRVFLDLGFGLALHDGPLSKTYGSRVLFHPQGELGVKFTEKYGLSVFVDHMSNGDTVRPNTGLNSAGIRLTYFF